MKISVVGAGYVGLSIAVLLSRHHKVTVLDIDTERVDSINRRIPPFEDAGIKTFFDTMQLQLTATLDVKHAYKGADFIIIATPTDYDPETNFFNTSRVESVVEQALAENKQATIVIKSTIPVGYTQQLRKKYNTNRIVFSPEFLREGKALQDNLHPTRIIVGDKARAGQRFSRLMADCAESTDTPVLLTEPTEAEAIKLFANTYLAMRVAYFNELDSYAAVHDLDAQSIIRGVCLDPRIGDSYNNPSFGYGGYCLPKDTKQLLANYEDVPQVMIRAIVEANSTRKQLIAQMIAQREQQCVGIYRLVMKQGSENFRDSAILDILRELKQSVERVVIYEPSTNKQTFMGCEVINDLAAFKEAARLVVANRLTPELDDVVDKVFTRDVYGIN